MCSDSTHAILKLTVKSDQTASVIIFILLFQKESIINNTLKFIFIKHA